MASLLCNALRQRRVIAFAAALLASGGCSPPAINASRGQLLPTGFPVVCRPDEVEVMMFGTYHMANPGLDAVKGDPDDVLTPSRQRELEALSALLATWRPQQIAVEALFDNTTHWQSRYAKYLAGQDPADRNEVVQIGFRLAKRLRHPTIYPIDVQMIIGNDSAAALFERRTDLRERSEAITAAMQRVADSTAPLLRTRSMIEIHREANTDRALHGGNSAGMFATLMPAGVDKNYGGPQVIAKWYERNIRMVHHLHRIVQPGTTRIMVIVGTGHVPPMRNILDEDPRFCPVSPLPLLSQ